MQPKTENGAYGIYPVQCTNVLVEGSQVRGSSDAGIYVGQSKNIIVRNNKVWENVAGIEIENSFGADVYDNEATNNTGGILVFSLPEMPVKNGRDARVFRNKIHGNNHPNFGLEGADHRRRCRRAPACRSWPTRTSRCSRTTSRTTTATTSPSSRT